MAWCERKHIGCIFGLAGNGELGGAFGARRWRATEAGEHEEKIL